MIASQKDTDQISRILVRLIYWKKLTFHFFQVWRHILLHVLSRKALYKVGLKFLISIATFSLKLKYLDASQKLQAIHYCCLVVSRSRVRVAQVWYLGLLLWYLNQVSYKLFLYQNNVFFLNWLLIFLSYLQVSPYIRKRMSFSLSIIGCIMVSCINAFIFVQNMMLGEFCMNHL